MKVGVGCGSLAILLLITQAQAQAPAATGAPEAVAARTATAVIVTPPGRPDKYGTNSDLLVRDVDTPALQPFRALTRVVNDFVNKQALITTVADGKRLVIESASWLAVNVSTSEVIFAALRVGEFGPIVQYLQINPAHVSANPGFTLQDGIQQGPVYVEAGEELWLSVSKNQPDAATFDLVLNGYLIDVP